MSGHSNGTVRYATSATATVVSPQTRNPCFVEIQGITGVGNGFWGGTGGVKFYIGKGINNGIALQIGRNDLLAFAVMLQVGKGRLVGNVEEALFVQIPFFEFLQQGRDELGEEAFVFLA